MTAHWRFSSAVPRFLNISTGIWEVQFDVRNVLMVSLSSVGTKTTNRVIFSANLVHLCNNVSLITPPKFSFQKPAIVEIWITNLGGHFLLGHPVEH